MDDSIVNVIIGGGAAGIFAAIRCKEKNPLAQVLLLEKTNQLLAKVRISGGGRCNVTHGCFDPAQLVQNYPRGSKELLGPFHTFQPQDTVRWFEERGVKLKVEEDGRMFPVTDSSETIIQCLLYEASKLGVEMRRQTQILSLEKTRSKFCIEAKNGPIFADSVLLATGSSSWGHAIAESVGHKIVSPVPSLFTFNVPSSPLLDLAGISVPNAHLSLQGTAHQHKGPLLLTHWGFSGPCALKLSAWAARTLHELEYQATLVINWVGAWTPEALTQTLLEKKRENPLQSFPPLLPNKLLARLLGRLRVDPSQMLGKIGDKLLAQIARQLTADPYTVEGKTTYKQEFVTAGGVDLKEIHWKTMESKLAPGLFFAGEICNIDGITGGFNFQNAWTTGWLAGTAMAQKF